MLKVGLTGGIASGKSHVSRTFAELGCRVYDSDQIARDVVAPETPGLQRLVEEFGKEILQADRSLDRAKLGALVFGDESKRQRLNQIIHPLIIAEQDRLIQQEEARNPDGIIIIDAALMIETGSYKRFDVLIVVYCNREEQLARLMRRNHLSRAEAEARINSQMATEEKLKYADYVIDSSGSFEQTRAITTEVYKQLLQKLKTNASDAAPTETTT